MSTGIRMRAGSSPHTRGAPYNGSARLRVHRCHEFKFAPAQHFVSDVEAIEAFGRLADDLRLIDDGVLAHIELLPRARRNNHKRDGNRRASTAAKNGSRTRQGSRYEVVLE